MVPDKWVIESDQLRVGAKKMRRKAEFLEECRDDVEAQLHYEAAICMEAFADRMDQRDAERAGLDE